MDVVPFIVAVGNVATVIFIVVLTAQVGKALEVGVKE
jgi:hypothetical protein